MFRPIKVSYEFVPTTTNDTIFIVKKMKPERDPFLCTCGPCKKFWRDTFSDSGDLLRESSQCRAHHTAILSAESKVVKIGDRILVQSRFPGTVKWVGVLDEDSIAPELYVGVRLDDNVNSTHNGVYNGKRYFHVPRGHGAMVKYMENIYSQAGMQGPQFVEPYASPPKTAATSVRASPVKSLREPIIHIGDPNDIALRDMQRLSQMDTKRKVRKEDKDKKEMERFKQHFGGVPEADRLALTLKKLKLAYQEGKTLMQRKTVKDYDAGSDSGITFI
ncbi:hypothetical protein MAR_027637 [Mya arenaria]|uniref:CAP-Gly domain-containing protein n=1 Tax=Mya arenaria TaxID=6604 RepID=A0ABY7EW35_MYAAR|nr:hypothetical protein MAR_027637 [Mya arenaria]